MKIFSSLIVGISILAAASAFAAPPAPTVPTGACAGLIKSSHHITFSQETVLSLAGTWLGELHASMYFDFDNSLAYVSVALEKAATSEQVDETGDDTIIETVTLVDGAAFTIEVSQTRPYALDVSIPFSYLGEEDTISTMLIPTNSGTTFLLHELDGPMSGVCQKI